MEFHVSPSGRDSDSGGAEYPFYSLGRAQHAARNYAGKEEVTIWLHEGTYRLTETLLFGPADGGTENIPVNYRAWKESRVCVTGSVLLENLTWKPWRDGIYAAPADLGEREIDQLFVNGRLMDRARFPNRGSNTSEIPGFAFFSGELSRERAAELNPETDEMSFPRAAPEGAFFNPETFSKHLWRRPEKAVVHTFQGMNWGTLQFRVREVDRKNNILWFGEGGSQIGCWTCPTPALVNEKSRFYVENVFEELDSPGEWYYDDDEKVLYLYPLSGVDLRLARIEIPVLKNFINVRGSQCEPVKNLHFSGINFCHTLSTFFELYDVPSNGDWALYRGGALSFEGTACCGVDNCTFTDMGGNAVFFSGYSRGNHVRNSYFARLGDSAVCIVGSFAATNGKQKNFAYQCSVSNCRMHHLGLYGKQSAGVFIAVSSHITVSHCHIHHVPRAAICINDGFCGGHVIEHNLIHDTCLETSDHGPFNSWGRSVYYCSSHSHGGGLKERPPVCHHAGDVLRYSPYTTIIRGNYFKDSRGWGIDLDDGSSNYHIYNNVCTGISIKLRDGAYRTVENNIFYKGANAPSFHMGHIDNHDIYRRNIIVMETGHAVPESDADFQPNIHNGAVYELHRPPMSGYWFLENDYNLFWSDCGIFKAKASVYTPDGVCAWTVFNLDSWREMGYDLHSQFAEPMLADPEKGDFRVHPDSPALKLGFVNFPMDQFGPGKNIPEPYEAANELCETAKNSAEF
jgi:hypothetical protein